MSPPKTEKTFDCLAYKDRVQAEIYEEIRDLTPQEQIEYFNRRAETGPLALWWKRIRRAPSGSTGAAARGD